MLRILCQVLCVQEMRHLFRGEAHGVSQSRFRPNESNPHAGRQDLGDFQRGMQPRGGVSLAHLGAAVGEDVNIVVACQPVFSGEI